MKRLTKDDVVFTLAVEDEHIPFVGNCMASGDAAVDKEAEDEIRTQLESGNVWAWCSVAVTATWEAPNGETFSASDYLGTCSYENEKDFKADGYYAGMCDQALESLNQRLVSLAAVFA